MKATRFFALGLILLAAGVAQAAMTPCAPNGFAGPYPCNKVDLMSFMPLSAVQCGSAAVVWGWTDPLNGKEYALLACNNGVSFVDISNPEVPVLVGRLPGAAANSTWRDVKTIGNWAYVGSEATNHGVQIFDLTRLRSVTSPPQTFTADAHYPTVGRSHTLATNPANNMLYASGSQTTCGGDLHQIDVSNPLAPVGRGCLTLNGYVHEAQCTTYIGPDTAHQGKQICVTSNGRFDDSDTLSIVDVTNPAAAVQLSRVSYPQDGYTHQTWFTEDQQYMLLNDEFDEQDFDANTRTHIWDVRNLDEPVYMGFYTGRTSAVDHNIYIRGNYAFCSNYRAGLSILDVRNIAAGPSGISEFGYFDIYPQDDAADYNANWGNYPYFPSGLVALSGIEQGLFIVKPKFLPTLSVNDVSVAEGTGETRLVTFTVTLSAPSTQNVSVDFSIADGTAVAGQDYIAPSPGTIIIPAGQTTRTKQIGIIADSVEENDETFFINLTPRPFGNADITDAQGVATIVDDDLAVSRYSVSDVSINEGDSGTSLVTVVISRSAPLTSAGSVNFMTVDGTATAGMDYDSGSNTVPFDPAEASKQITFTIHGDMAIEPNEFFTVVLSSPVGGEVGDGQATVTIINDDNLSVDAVSPSAGPASGGSAVTFTGSRFGPGLSIHFGETHAMDVLVVNDTTATATTPAMPPATLVPIHAHIDPMHGPTGIRHRGEITFFSNFLDVPNDYLFHSFIEKVFRLGITAGCGSGNYCPEAPVQRQQMAVFLLTAKFSNVYVPPEPQGIFADLPVGDPFTPWAEDLYQKGITAGCASSPLRFCPGDAVTRGQMAVFLLSSKEGPGYTPPPCTGIFADVPCGTDPFAPWIEELYQRGITAGCGGGNYCPFNPVTRGQMALFLVTTFGLTPE
jgi:choice-of-anchor B domain-containing protein